MALNVRFQLLFPHLVLGWSSPINELQTLTNDIQFS